MAAAVAGDHHFVPVPEPGDDQLHAYLEVGHMQGMRQPVTPMGMSLLMYGTADWFKAYGVAIDPEQIRA